MTITLSPLFLGCHSRCHTYFYPLNSATKLLHISLLPRIPCAHLCHPNKAGGKKKKKASEKVNVKNKQEIEKASGTWEFTSADFFFSTEEINGVTNNLIYYLFLYF